MYCIPTPTKDSILAFLPIASSVFIGITTVKKDSPHDSDRGKWLTLNFLRPNKKP